MLRIIILILVISSPASLLFAQNETSLSGEGDLIEAFRIHDFAAKYLDGYEQVIQNDLWYHGYIYTFRNNDDHVLITIGLYPTIEITELIAQDVISDSSTLYINGPYKGYDIGDMMWFQIVGISVDDGEITRTMFIRKNMLISVKGATPDQTLTIAQNVDNDVLSRNEDYLSFSTALNFPVIQDVILEKDSMIVGETGKITIQLQHDLNDVQYNGSGRYVDGDPVNVLTVTAYSREQYPHREKLEFWVTTEDHLFSEKVVKYVTF